MTTKPTYVVTFRNSIDKLTCMMTEKYHSVKAAKEAIEYDAAWFTANHKYCGYPVGMKFRQKTGWVNPSEEDYYEVRAQDGAKCVWQYFKI